MRRIALAVLATTVMGLAACAPKLPKGVDESALTQAVGKSIGSPSTCVVIADANGGAGLGAAAAISPARATRRTAWAARRTPRLC
ncbi:hypothetical protein ACRAWD_09860 [Caulobacter segnis]